MHIIMYEGHDDSGVVYICKTGVLMAGIVHVR